MKILLSSFLALTIFTKNVFSHAGHDHGNGIMDADSDITDHDLDHLKDAIKTQKPIKEMSKDERQFYYFKQADTDNNDKLDGLEMLQTMIKFEIEDAEYSSIKRNRSV